MTHFEKLLFLVEVTFNDHSSFTKEKITKANKGIGIMKIASNETYQKCIPDNLR